MRSGWIWGSPLDCAPTQAPAPAAVLKGQLPDCCGAARGRARVLPTGLRLRGRRALTPVPLRPALCALLRGRRLALLTEARGLRRSGRGGEGGGSGRGEARLVRPGRRGAERRRPPPATLLLPGLLLGLAGSLARSRGPRPARRSPDTGTRRAQPHSPPEGGAALGPKKP